MELETLRQEIDVIDKELLALFEKRMDVAKQVGSYKLSHGIPVLDESREQQVLKNRLALLKNREYAEGAQELFCTLMDVSKDAQKKLMPKEQMLISPQEVVAYQGVEGAYSEAALEAYFDEETERVCLPGFRDVFEAVTNGEAKYGVLPIENSSAGSVIEVMDLLIEYNCFIVGEQLLEVHHCLVGLPDACLEDIKTVCSHPQGLMQCAAYLREMGFSQQAQSNTAASAKLVATSGDKTLGAIASKRAAEQYGLKILAENICSSRNTTRFIVISPVAQTDEKSDKISTAFTLKHESGTLYRAISCFAGAGLNMLKIESRPARRNWEYRFFVDFEGNLEDEAVQRAVVALKENCTELRILGNYQKSAS